MAPRVRLVVLRGARPGYSYPVGAEPVVVGRGAGGLDLSEDPNVAPRHATLWFQDGRLFVRDEGSPSGTFVRIRTAEPLSRGARFTVGERLLCFGGFFERPPASETPSYGAPIPAGALLVLQEILVGDRPGRTWLRPATRVSIGRTGCEINLADEPHIGPRVCELIVRGREVVLQDLGMTEGTHLRLAPGTERALGVGDTLRMGDQLLRVES